MTATFYMHLFIDAERKRAESNSAHCSYLLNPLLDLPKLLMLIIIYYIIILYD